MMGNPTRTLTEMSDSKNAIGTPPNGIGWSDNLATALSDQRAAALQFLSQQGTRLNGIEQRLQQQRDAFVHCRSEWDRVRLQWSETQRQIDEASDDMTRERSELVQQKDRLADREQDIAKQLEQVEGRRHELDEKAAALVQLELRLDEQRLQLRQQDQSSNDQADLVCQLQARVDQITKEMQELDSQSSSELDAARISLMNARRDQETLRKQTDAASRQHAEELAERDGLIEQLRTSAQKLRDDGCATHNDEAWQDLQQRYETALADVRELRTRNDELEGQLAHAPTSVSGRKAPQGALNWEAQKKLLMEQLDDEELNASDAARQQERLSIQEALRATELAMAKKNAEIKELEERLTARNPHSAHPGGQNDSVVFGAQGIAAFLDQDELIQLERENLQRLQDEWREKLRHAEVELSVERARLARERLEIDERLRDFEYNAKQPSSHGSEVTEEKATGRRWLTRLGLAGNDD